jgi:hypothetical protein
MVSNIMDGTTILRVILLLKDRPDYKWMASAGR